jgi:hypothetical protein
VLGRNEEAQELLKMTAYFEQKCLMKIITEGNNFCDNSRYRALKLLSNLYLDRKPFEPLVVPSETIVWSQLKKMSKTKDEIINEISANMFEFTVKKSKARVPESLQKLKEFVEHTIKQTKGTMKQSDTQRNELIFQSLKVIEYMVSHGFYEDMKGLSNIATPIIMLLSGANDSYEDKFDMGQSMIQTAEPEVNMSRYFPSAQNDVVVKVKNLCCDILCNISNVELDAHNMLFINRLK